MYGGKGRFQCNVKVSAWSEKEGASMIRRCSVTGMYLYEGKEMNQFDGNMKEWC